MKKLRDYLNIKTNWQLFIILFVFSVTGSSAVILAEPIIEAMGLTKEMGWFYYWPPRFLIIFPVYQVLLVVFGWLFGEFAFFWRFEKKMIRRMGLGFLLRNE